MIRDGYRRPRWDDETEGERTLRRLIVAALFLAAAILGAMLARADVRLDFAALVRGSDAILVGRVTSLACRDGSFEGVGTIPFTDVTLAVEPGGVLLGDASDSVTLAVPGGESGDLVVVCAEAPAFAVGQRVLVFVRDCGSERRVHGLEAGKYALEGDVVVGRPGAPLPARIGLRDLSRAIATARRNGRRR